MTMLTPPGLRAPRRKPNWRFLLPVALGLLLVMGALGWLVASLTGGEGNDQAATVPTPNASSPSSTPRTRTPTSPTTTTLKPLDRYPPAVSVQVNVYNATDQSGLAKAVADKLATQNFSVADFGNDPKRSDGSVPALIRYGPGGQDSAQTLALVIPNATFLNDKRRDDSVDLVLGRGFPGVQAAPPGTWD